MPDKANETMRPNEVCEALGGISIATLNRRIAAGEITPLPKPAGLKKVHERVFDRAEVERYIKANS